jgi:flagellar biosynthesis GTPase FlhF
MRVRSFHAPTAREALLLAERELGGRARIVTTRSTARGIELIVAEGLDGGVGDGALRDELRSLREQVANVAFVVPPGLEDLARRLANCGFGAEWKTKILAAAAPHRGLAAYEAAENALAAAIPVLPARGTRGGTRVVALVGPTGSGKTTTIAKLAGRLAAAKRRVALLTLDTYRVGAVQQLRSYAEMLGSPFEAILSPADAAEAVARASNCDVVLIDTTGRSPFDAERLSQLSVTLQSAGTVETLLVCAASSSERALRESAARFATLAPTGMVVTKLDETQQIAPAFALAAERRLPVAFLCAGQEVPVDLERANAIEIAKRLLRAGAVEEAAA